MASESNRQTQLDIALGDDTDLARAHVNAAAPARESKVQARRAGIAARTYAAVALTAAPSNRHTLAWSIALP